MQERAWVAVVVLVIAWIAGAVASKQTTSSHERLQGVRAVWRQEHPQPLDESDLRRLRQQAWAMFDHGFSNYMNHAFPKDNLLPVSCGGQDWQGGLALTLVDSLDMLVLLNRRGDVTEALARLEGSLSFDKDVKVHVFETTIRILGGLLSGHVLLEADPGLAPGYDGLLLRRAADLGDRLLAAFDTPSGLPGGHVHLQKGLIEGENISCTACAGTLLLEFGLLSRLTGNASYLAAANHAAFALFDKRSSLGLVGSGFHVHSRDWSHRDATIGPGSDSYYEYLLKAYLMFGDERHLAMFTELYTATMRHMQVPGQQGASSSAFLLDVHMDSGRLLKPWVSSLGAFWPAMQVLAGQNEAAEALHANFTAAWRTWGWLPEMFGADLSSVHPEDPGYNLRPEHIESTWYLKAVSGDPGGDYSALAAAMMAVLNHSRVDCGYAPIRDVTTGVATDLMESYFLSETVKYLYLSFVDSGPLLDYWLLSTEGHLMPSFPHPGEELALQRLYGSQQDEEQERDRRHQRQEQSGDGDAGAGSSKQQEEPGDSDTADGQCSSGFRQADDEQPADDAGSGSAAAAAAAVEEPADECDAVSCADVPAITIPAINSANTSSSSSGDTAADAHEQQDKEAAAARVLQQQKCCDSRRAAAAAAEAAAANASSSSSEAEPQHSLVPWPLSELPSNCRSLCVMRSAHEEAVLERRLHAALPLLPVRRADSRRIRYRRCVACIQTSRALAAKPPDSPQIRLARLNFGDPAATSSPTAVATGAAPAPPAAITNGSALAQVVCVLGRTGPRSWGCSTLRRLTALDNAVGLAPGTLVLQLTAVTAEPPPPPSAELLVSFVSADDGPTLLATEAVSATFAPPVAKVSKACMRRLQRPRPRLELLPDCPPHRLMDSPYLISGGGSSSAAARARLQQLDTLRRRSPDPWLGVTPSSSTCRAVLRQAAAVAGIFNTSQAADAAFGKLPAAGKAQPSSSSNDRSTTASVAVAADGASEEQQQQTTTDQQLQANSQQQKEQQDRSAQEAPEAVLFDQQQHQEQEQERQPAADPAMPAAQLPPAPPPVPAPTPALLSACVGLDITGASISPGAPPPATWLPLAELQRLDKSGRAACASAVTAPTGPLVLAQPLHACTGGAALANAASLAGAIVLLSRGGCSFLDKVMAVQRAGGVAAVVLNLTPPGDLVTMSGDESGRVSDIPAVLVGGEDATGLRWWAERRPLLGTVVEVATQQQQAASGGATAAAAGKGPAQQKQQLSSRVDLYVPARSRGWLLEHVSGQGGSETALFEDLVRDGRVVAELQRAAAFAYGRTP